VLHRSCRYSDGLVPMKQLCKLDKSFFQKCHGWDQKYGMIGINEYISNIMYK